MERLNEIISRAAQRRPREQRPPQGAAPQGQRPGQHLARRSLPEQTAHLGQQAPYVYQPDNQYSQHSTPPPTRDGRGGGERMSSATQWREGGAYVERSRQSDTRGERHSDAGEGAGQFPPQASRPAPGYTRQRLPAAYQQPRRPEPTDEYYAVDAPPNRVRADVTEEWEEDVTAMRYGDWEYEEDDTPIESSRYLQGGRSAERPGAPLRVDAVSPRDPNLVPDPAPRSPITRNLRAVRGPVTQPPIPQAPTQEAGRYHRITQPLNPQRIAKMSQDNPSEAPRTQQPMRQIELREQPRQLIPAPYIAPAKVCPICKGAGYLRANVPYGHPNFGKPIACECKEAERKEKRRQELLELSDLSAFRNKSFKNFSTRFTGAHPSVQEAFQEAYKFAQDPNGWLVLLGPNGCGKTHLAAAIANQNLSAGAVVLFTVVPDLLAHLRATFAPTSTEAYDQRFSKMREAELLVLDDLGAHQSSPWANEKLFQLLNYRYNSGYPTVITANKQGLATIDERILSRLSDTALVTAVVLNGALDYRRQNPRQEPIR